MNLTDPPEVHDPATRRLEDLRAALVDRAAADIRPRTRPAWVPALAATAGVAAVATAVVAVPRLTPSDTAPPVASSPTSAPVRPTGPPQITRLTPSTPVPVTPPIRPSRQAGTVTGDLGPAGEADARRTLGRCFQSPGQVAFRKADTFTATIEWARWMATPASFGPTSEWTVETGRQLVVSVRRNDGLARALCVDDGNDIPGDEMIGGWDGVSVADRDPALSARRPFVGGASFGDGMTTDGRWLARYTTPFSVLAKTARVDLRLTWPGGASRWESAAVHSPNGYAEVTAIGTGKAPAQRDIRAEVRLTDAAGTVFATLSGPVTAPLTLN